jgi:hypothetical protein
VRWGRRNDFAEPLSAANREKLSLFCNGSRLSQGISNGDKPSREVVKLALMNDLFPADVDLGQRRSLNGGCAEPIGKQGRSRRRSYRVRSATSRQTTLTVLVDIRRTLNADLTTLRQGQQQIRQGQHSHASMLSDTNDLVQHLLGRVSKLERAAGIVEQPQAPRPARNRLFD